MSRRLKLVIKSECFQNSEVEDKLMIELIWVFFLFSHGITTL